jgi:hypothetical protein
LASKKVALPKALQTTNFGIANAAHCHPQQFALPKAFQTTNFGIANAAHCHPQQFALPKAFQTTNFVCCLAFLTLIRSIKRACFAASH